MEKQEIFNHYAAILDKMIDNYDFYKTYFQSTYSADYYPEIEGVTLAFGASRGCLIDPEFDWVVKWDCAQDQFGSCCAREAKFFEEAKNFAVEDMLAPTYFLGTYTKVIWYWDFCEVREVMGWDDDDDVEYWREKIQKNLSDPYKITISIPLYCQMRAELDNVENPRTSSYDKKYFQNSKSPLCQRAPAIGMDFAEDYGMDSFEALTEFCFDFDINDIHWGNVGMINGKIVLIDYSGYYAGDCDENERSEGSSENSDAERWSE